MSPDELEQLYDRHAEALFRYLCTFVRGEEVARDLLQDLFVKIARNPGCMGEVRNEKAYLFRLAHNLAIDKLRRRSVRKDKLALLANEPIPLFAKTADPDGRSVRQSLARALTDLPESQRETVYLRLFEDMTFEAIASLLSISANTAASRYRYGIIKLRERLRPLYDDIN